MSINGQQLTFTLQTPITGTVMRDIDADTLQINVG